MAISTPLFAAHARRWQDHRYVYPVVSRRSHGLSIGINLNPDQACNLDCVYCSVDRRGDAPRPGPRVDEAVLRAELDHLLGLAASGEFWRLPPFDHTPPELRRLNDVAFSGDGEPTSYPGFATVCRTVAELIAWHQLGGVKIVVITNATLLDRPMVVEALDYLAGVGGEVWAKLDAGTEGFYQLVDRSKVPLARVLRNLLACGRRHPLVIQSLFMRLHGEAPPAAEIAAWLARLSELAAGGCQIALVQVYTVARAPAEAYVSPLDDQALDLLCRRVQALGLPAKAFYAPR